ncbi:MAG: hypothetical protein HY678_03870 [Chloroflexi bacterium]|nr:hypothetical protein [Chloroflexota bacterium]
MTWAERVGDLSKSVALLFINLGRVFTLAVRIAAELLDRLVVNLAERGEEGIRPLQANAKAYISIPTTVAWLSVSIVLRVASIATVLARQATTTADEFLRHLAEVEA